MSSKLKTAVVIDDSAIIEGTTIDASKHNTPLGQTETEFRAGRASVSDGDTHLKHLEDAIIGVSGKTKITKLNPAANEQLALDLDATGVPNSYTPVANGANEWSWAASGGGGAAPIDVTGTAGENLALRDYVYLDESSNTWFKVDTDVTPVACGRIRGIVNEALGIASAATGSIRLLGEISGYIGLTAWQPVYASTTAGGITQTRPSPTSGGAQVAIIEIGLAVSTSNIVLLPPKAVQYMQRNDALANDGTITIQHHKDEMGHTRLAKSYVSSDVAGATLEEYTSANQDTQVGLEDKTVATYTADLTSGETFSADSVLQAGTEEDKAFDDTISTFWASANTAYPHWIEVQFAAAKTIRRYTIRSRDDAYYARAPKDFELQYYDGAIWQTADTQTNINTWIQNEVRTFDVSTGNSATRWRIYGTSNQESNLLLSMPEIEMMEVATWADGADKLAQTISLGAAETVASKSLYLRKVGLPTGTLTIRLETVDGSNNPTGTLADVNATQTLLESSLSTSFADVLKTFTNYTPGAGTYAIVLSTDRVASEINYVEWGCDSSAPSYAGGEGKSFDGTTWTNEAVDFIFNVTAAGTTFVEPAVIGRWGGGTRDIAIRYDDGAALDPTIKTTFKNVLGVTADVTAVLELI